MRRFRARLRSAHRSQWPAPPSGALRRRDVTDFKERAQMPTRWIQAVLIALALSPSAAGCASTPPECAAGGDGCRCESGGVCDDGLVCTDGTCERPREVSLTVDDPAARACEALLRDGDAEVASVRFEGASGAHVREEPLTSVSFAAAGDVAIAGGAVRVEVVGDGTFTVESARCFDGAGQEIAGATVRVGG
jgi:hypothetical protein